jgi:hypothetical protein
LVVSDWVAPIATEYNNQFYYSEIKISKFSLPQISDLQATTGLLSGTQWATRAFRTISATATSSREQCKSTKFIKNKKQRENLPLFNHY